MRELKISNISWVSLVRPREEDIRDLAERFPEIHPLILDELKKPTIRPRVENYDHHLYLVMHFPGFMDRVKKMVFHEVDFILTKNALITIQYNDLPLLTDFWHECQGEEAVRERYGKTPVHLFYYLLRKFFSLSLRELDQIQEKIDALEEKVFAGKEKEVLWKMSLLKRNVLDFRRAIKPQHLTLESLATQGIEMYGEKVKPILLDLVGEYLKVWNLLENHKETLDALYETNNSLLNARINEIMKAFTILAFITFIPNLVANTYLLGQNFGFEIVIGGMTLLVILMYLLALKLRKLV